MIDLHRSYAVVKKPKNRGRALAMIDLHRSYAVAKKQNPSWEGMPISISLLDVEV